MIITNLGLSNIVNAQAQGLRLKVTEFAVGDGINYLLEPSLTNIYGTSLYRGSITNIEVVLNTVQFTCEVPENTGPFTITEIGLYTDTGVLFAIGKVDPYFSKSPSVTWRSIVSLLLSTMDAATISVNTHRSLPYISDINELEGPHNTIENCVIVGNAHSNVEDEPSSTIVTKYGGPSDISSWSFLGHSRYVYQKTPVVIEGNNKFTLPPNVQFWANDGEQVLVQVVVGDATGQTRAYTYNHKLTVVTPTGSIEFNRVFSLVGTDIFTNFSSLDKINIWRSDSHTLPSVNGVQNGQALQVVNGRPSWATMGGSYDVSLYRRKLKTVRHLFVGDAVTRTFTLPVVSYWSIVAIDGVLQHQSAYSVVGTRLTFVSPPCVGTHEAVLYVPDTTSNSTGSRVSYLNEQYFYNTKVGNFGYASASKVLLENTPAFAEDLLVFHGHLLVRSNDYLYNAAENSITFSKVLYSGLTEIKVPVFTQTTDNNVPVLRKIGNVGTGITITVPVPSTWVEADSILSIQGGYVGTGGFDLVTGTVDVNGNDLTPGVLTIAPTIEGRPIELMVWENGAHNINSVLYRGDLYVPALNSLFDSVKDGDVRTVNKLFEVYYDGIWRQVQESQVPHVLQFVGNNDTTFDLQVIPKGKETVRVNVEGKILMLSEYQLTGSKLVLSQKLNVGKKMECIIFNFWML